jgi:hypothetical protein
MAFSYFQLGFLIIIRYSTGQFNILINIKYYFFKKIIEACNIVQQLNDVLWGDIQFILAVYLTNRPSV